MSALSFGAAYLQWLRRQDRTVKEPEEPIPADHGLLPTKNAFGAPIEHPLAEPLRKRLRAEWESEIIERAKKSLPYRP